MMAAGKVNASIVERLQRLGVNAVGLAGLDGRLLEGRRKATIRIVEDGKQKVLRDDWTGTVERVNTGLADHAARRAGYLPVLAPLASSTDGEAINVDGDRAAAAVAAALQRRDAAAALERARAAAQLPRRVLADRTDRARRGRRLLPVAQGRMKKKVLGAAEALSAGVGRVILGDARTPQPISKGAGGGGDGDRVARTVLSFEF